MNLVIIDYGIGNVQSLTNTLNTLDINVLLSDNPDIILNADALILPGVGAFKKAFFELTQRNLDYVIKKFVSTQKPLLGICLGMQLLFDSSNEFGFCNGLGLIEGNVKKFPESITEKLPHVNWNSLLKKENTSWSDTVLIDVNSQEDFYFVHSFICHPEKEEYILATTEYGGINFCSVVKKNNIYGCQFHPEKSGLNGLKILNEFVHIAKRIK
jgi:imidazole glycerol-phosphate synthase subunit HisH